MSKHQTQLRQIEVELPQIKQVENHLLVHGKITTWKAITGYGITRLSEYIRVLRHEKDWNIPDEWKYKRNSSGKIIKKWKEYQLKNYPNA